MPKKRSAALTRALENLGRVMPEDVKREDIESVLEALTCGAVGPSEWFSIRALHPMSRQEFSTFLRKKSR